MRTISWVRISINFSIVLVYIVGFIYIGLRYEDYVDNLRGLSDYYMSMENIKKSNGYDFLSHIISFLFMLSFIFLFIITTLIDLNDENHKFRYFPGVRTKYKEITYFKLIGYLLIINILYLSFLVDERYFDYIIPIVLFIIMNLFRYLNTDIVFKETHQKIKLIEKGEEEEDLATLKQTKIKYIFFTLLIITIISLAITGREYVEYRQYVNIDYPKELLVTEESKIDHISICLGYNALFCFDDRLLDNYHLSTIEFFIDEKDLSESLDKYDILLKYNDQTFYLNAEDYITKIDYEYRFQMDVQEYIRSKEQQDSLERYEGLEIKFVDSEKQAIKNQPTVVRFEILFHK